MRALTVAFLLFVLGFLRPALPLDAVARFFPLAWRAERLSFAKFCFSGLFAVLCFVDIRRLISGNNRLLMILGVLADISSKMAAIVA